MARDYISIGPAPVNESCVQVGTENYQSRARAECNRFIEVIRGVLGQEPEGAGLGIKSNPHDFGSYLEVVCHFDDDDDEARAYAYRCEGEAPSEWGDLPEPGEAPPEQGGAPGDYLGLPINSGSTETKANSAMMSCNFCPEEMKPVVDGRTKMGPWAAMCEKHFKEHGIGLGTGYGQKLVEQLTPPERPAPMTVGAVLQAKRKRPTRVCDSCRDTAEEMGLYDEESQSLIMAEMGLDVGDHLCDDDESGGCLCACSKRFHR